MNDAVLTEPGKAEQSAVTANGPTAKRTPLTKVLPTDRISFENQVDLLRAFAAVHASNNAQPVTNEQAGEVLTKKLSGSTVSQTNGFFSDVGLVTRAEKGTGFIPSEEVIEYNNSCQWDEAEARLKLRPVFEKTWFYRCLVPRLQLAPQPQATCLALLANESKATTEHNEKLVNLIKFLELAGIISSAGGTITLLQHRAATQERLLTPPLDQKPPPPADGAEQHVLFLDKDRKKKVVLSAPLAISRAEYDRICKWLEVALIVEEKI